MPVELNKLDNEQLIAKESLDKLLEKKGIFNEAIEIEKAGTTKKLITEIPTISNYGKKCSCSTSSFFFFFY